MKIVTLVWSIGIGGTERAAVNYAIGYKKFGHDSKVIVLGEGYDRYPALEEANVETVLVCQSPQTINQILSEFKAWQPHIIHIHNYTDDILSYINLIKSKNTKVVETNVFSRPNYNKNYQIVNLSMQLSAWGYWKYTRWMKKTKYCPEVAVVPYIVDGAKFIKPSTTEINNFLISQNIPASSFVIGRLGQPHPSKWDIKIIDVIKKTILSTNNIYYLFVGLPNNLEDLINKQSPFFNSRVIKIKKIEGDEKLSLYYHSLNCFAHISQIGESFGYVLAEVLLCKVPVISMVTPLKDNAQLEIIGNGFGGFCTATSKDFINKIKFIYNNKTVSDSLKINLDGWIENRFSYEAVIPSQIKLYESLLTNKKNFKISVNHIIKANFELYGIKKTPLILLSKFVNSYHFYNIIMQIKSLKKNFKRLVINNNK